MPIFSRNFPIFPVPALHPSINFPTIIYMRRYVFSATTVLLTLAVIGCASMRSEVDFGREHEAKGDYTTAILSYASAHVNGEITEDAWEAELARMESELTEADFEFAKRESEMKVIIQKPAKNRPHSQAS